MKDRINTSGFIAGLLEDARFAELGNYLSDFTSEGETDLSDAIQRYIFFLLNQLPLDPNKETDLMVGHLSRDMARLATILSKIGL